MGQNYPQHPQLGVLMMVIWCILLTPVVIYFIIKSKSVIAAALLHGTMNATASISVIPIRGGNDLVVGIIGLAGFIALILFIAGIFIYKDLSAKKT